MIDLRSIRAVALDIAGAGDSYERQEEITDFIWCLLERNYTIFLLTSDAKDDLSQEDFQHPGMRYLREEMPPSSKTLESHPELTSPHTLWISDDASIQNWVGDSGASLGYRIPSPPVPSPNSLRINRLSELSAMLDPTGFVLSDLTRMVTDLRRSHPAKPLVVGIGGPPLSDFQTFALALREHLQDAGFDLVELMDMSSLLRSTEQVLSGDHVRSHPWTGESIGRWVETHLLERIRNGEEIFLESAPEDSPSAFEPHFPFFLSSESVLLIFAELLFHKDIVDALDLSVLLEMTPEETTRRLYEIPTLEGFDPKFTEQYMAREGKVYQDYLHTYRASERNSIRIDANHPGALHIITPDPSQLN